MSDYLPALARTSRIQRMASRELDRVHARATLEVAETRAVEAVEAAKVEALGSVATVALAEVAHLTTVEVALAEQNPYAYPRLRHAADTASAEIAERVRRMNRRLG